MLYLRTMNTNPIGLFDSGVGGLTILGRLQTCFPNESYVYVGDSGRAPYGDKSFEELYQINKEIVAFLREKNIKMLVMACNTSCANFLDTLQQELPFPVIGLITPASKSAVLTSKNKRIAVLGTTQTISKHVYAHEIQKLLPEAQVLELAGPELVPLVESGQMFSDEGIAVCRHYMKKILDFGADTLIYGCSHYPYFEPVFKRFAPQITYIDPAKCIVPDVNLSLDTLGLYSPQTMPGLTRFFVSGDTAFFSHFLSARNRLNQEFLLESYLPVLSPGCSFSPASIPVPSL
ncbi:glutamate racemase [Thermoproteota archaeon]